MTEKKHKTKTQPENAITSEEVEVLKAELEAQKALAAEAQTKTQEYLDALQRERADFTNFRRRAEQEKSQTWQLASGDAIKKLLPVLDDLERALQHRPADDAWANGIELLYRKFQSTLEKEGVKPIDAVGQPFDPNVHEAIMQEASEEYETGTVIAVLQQGYLHGERVLRPALVKVAQ